MLSGAGRDVSHTHRSLQDNRETAERMLTHGEQLLSEWRHPDPIIGEASSQQGSRVAEPLRLMVAAAYCGQ